MDQLAIIFIVSFLSVLAITPLFSKLSITLGVIDHPSKKKFHLTSMPLLGGAAIVTVFYLSALYFCGPQKFMQFGGLLAAAMIMFIAGLVDDVRSKGILPGTKLILQALASALMIIGGLRLRATGIAPIDIAMTVVWVAGISNALNLLDNIDGLSSGTAAITSCFFALFALIVGKPDVARLAVIFSGCCMGFLFHNFHPASLFLGDAGSMFLGTMLAGFGLLVAKPEDVVSTLAIGVLLGLLFFDTGLVSIMRIMHGLKITQGGKDHTSHRLCNLGLSVQGSVTTLFAANFVFGAAAIAMLKLERNSALLIPLVLFLVGATCWFLLKDSYNYGKETN